MNLGDYKTLVFDCDGVVLNSNMVKTEAFFNAALPYGDEFATALVDYHVANGGISRYRKFEFFLSDLVPPAATGPNITQLLTAFAHEVRKGLLACEVAAGLRELREKTRQANWLIVSGGDQAELRDIFFHRDLDQLFDGGIFGSPDSKDEILLREINNKNIQFPALFLGDSKYDLEAAKRAGCDFVFVRAWSEWLNFQNCEDRFDFKIAKLQDLL